MIRAALAFLAMGALGALLAPRPTGAQLLQRHRDRRDAQYNPSHRWWL